MRNFGLFGHVKVFCVYIRTYKEKGIRDRKLKNSMSPERAMPYVIKSNYYKAAALNSDSEEMRKAKQKDANMNSFCSNVSCIMYYE